MDGEETVKAAMISSEIRTEWKTPPVVSQATTRYYCITTERASFKRYAQGNVSELEQDCLHWLDDSRFHSFSGKKLFSNED